MRFLITLTTQLIWLATALAAPPLTITDSGYYLTVVDSSGVPTLERVETIVDLRSGETPHPEPPSDPDQPQPPDGIGADVAEWSAEVGDPAAAQKYALIFETVRDGVLAGDIDKADIFRVLKESADGLIGDDWTAFRQRLGDYLVDQSQRGNLGTKPQVVEMMELVRGGLSYSARDSELLSPADAAAVVAKVNSVLGE